MDYTNDALYGGQSYNSAIGANMMNPNYANGPTDWGSILTNGIRGAAEGAMAGLVAEKYASGQLVMPPNYQAQQPKSIMPLLVIGAIVYVVMKG